MTKRKLSTRTLERNARTALIDVIDMAGYARGMAQWVNGYRTAGKDSDDTLATERSWWRLVTKREAAVKSAISAYRRAILAGAKK